MIYAIREGLVVIKTANHQASFSKKEFSRELLTSDILEDLSFNDLQKIWDDLHGIPNNIKALLLRKIELYRSSSDVKSFIYNNKEYWIDKNNRTSLLNVCNFNLGDVDLVLGDQVVSLPSTQLKTFLLKLESYACKCFVNASKHLVEASKLESIEDIINYDYTTGYPEKIVLQD